MKFHNRYVNARKMKQYEEIRRAITDIYSTKESLYFWTFRTIIREEYFIENFKTAKRSEKSVQETVKKISQDFWAAVTSGRRSGSGKIIIDFYDDLLFLRPLQRQRY